MGIFNRALPTTRYILSTEALSVSHLQQHLCESLKLRVLNVPASPDLSETHNVRIAILFSGGLDCAVLARIAHDLLPVDQEIDLINVAFENPRVVEAAKKVPRSKKHSPTNIHENPPIDIPKDIGSQGQKSFYESCPDRETGRKAFQELQDVCHHRVWRFVAVKSLLIVSFFASSPDIGQRSLYRNYCT